MVTVNGVQFVIDQPIVRREDGNDKDLAVRYVSHADVDWAEPRYDKLSMPQPEEDRGDLLSIMARRESFLSSVLRHGVGS
jgi:hypothetical protein